jgi:hypothetical protein
MYFYCSELTFVIWYLRVFQLISINLLMEFCKELFNGEAPSDKPELLDINWPILEVAFDLPSDDVPMFEVSRRLRSCTHG